MTRQGKRHRWRRIATYLSILLVAYLLVAYLTLPDVWRRYESEPGLAQRPMITVTSVGIPGDPLNVGLVGNLEEIVRAFAAIGWSPADAITMRTSIDIAASVVFDRPYPTAPVSPLYYEGRKQDLAFEKPDGRSADRRHHVRLWLVLEKGSSGRPLWLGSVTFDQGAGLSHDTGQITHHIGPDIDAEREALIDDLSQADVLSDTYRIAGSGRTSDGRNGGGDRYFTDGEIVVGVLKVPD
jgi:hypothetical protein